MGYDKRIGQEFLKPGPGWGGSCFPKDTKALVRIAEDAGYDFGLLHGVIAVNEEQLDRVVTKIRTAAGGSVDGVRIAVWGLTFKARTDDLRDSPSLAIIRRLLAEGADVVAYDPTVTRPLRRHRVRRRSVRRVRGRRGARRPHRVGRVPLARPRPRSPTPWPVPAVVDARNLLDRNERAPPGFDYRASAR